ncbi:hypothetical protein [Pseudoxanthomonas gei]|uniref:hypothetical protein n=1 Tax=Pseudoxanthomonas gei TaxID=1383030 RepID=UPI001390935C|nr:hypothetical protein [Pseudoxanthomonas gei]
MSPHLSDRLAPPILVGTLSRQIRAQTQDRAFIVTTSILLLTLAVGQRVMSRRRT